MNKKVYWHKTQDRYWKYSELKELFLLIVRALEVGPFWQIGVSRSC